MEWIKEAIQFVLQLDKNLIELVANYGTATYLILFAIIFLETGVVITPFLPGDSLLFAAGAIAATGHLDVFYLLGLLFVAAFIGDTLNYTIGKYIGPKIFAKENVRFLNKKYLMKAHEFYEKYGGKTIIIARFIPIIRTFAPFVAGIGEMTYSRFILFNILGGILWVVICLFAGYFFGGLPFVKNNFSLVVLAIIVISIIPAVIEFIIQWRKSKKEKEQSGLKK